MSEYTVVTQGFVSVLVIFEGNSYGVEKRYPKDILVVDLKNKLELITGFVATDMKLSVLSKERKFICEINDDNKMIGFYPIDDGCVLNVDASQKIVTCSSDDPNFKKFELTDEEYAQKRGTVREFKERMKLGRFSDKTQDVLKKKEEEVKEKTEQEKKLIENMPLNSRCQVNVPGHMERLATVMYVGELDNKEGFWVGVKYDEPLGKNDGSVEGKQYFKCMKNYGGFVKPEYVVVGDFPEENFDEL
jgi:tubulin-folding cofactor B